MTELLRTSSSFLVGQLLLAMPAIGDPRFHRAMIFLCAHDAAGAMGLVLTQPMPGLSLAGLMDRMEVVHSNPQLVNIPVLNGGPVEPGRGFVLHPSDFRQKETVVVGESFGVTGTVDILQQIARGEGPSPFHFLLGYAGWTAGQLEQELADNVWLTLPASPALVFDTPLADRWEAAMQGIGIDPAQLSGVGGHA